MKSTLPWTNEEIVHSWNNCENPSEQVKILAQLNGCKESLIKNILHNANIESFRALYCDKSGKLIEHKIIKKYRLWTERDDELIVTLKEDKKMSWAELGKTFDTSPAACRFHYYSIIRNNNKQKGVV